VRVVIKTASDYPEVDLCHLYVDNAAMQLVEWPKQFDVMVTKNLFGDILSDAAAMLTGSIGMLPSASLDANSKGMYEPIHGSAPRSEEHTSELQSRLQLVCRLLLAKKTTNTPTLLTHQ